MFSKMLTDTLVLLLCTAATAGENDDVVHVAGLLGGSARLPCDTTPPTKENPVILVIWLKEPAPNPIYTYDLRTDGRGNHWYDSFNLGGRAFYNGENSSSFLAIENLQEKDRGRYRCRVDFDKAPAKIYKVALQVVVPSQPPVLVTGEGIQLEEIQYFEGSHLTVHCRVKGGVPPPQLFWFVNGKSVEGVPMNRPRSQQLHQGIPGLGSSAVDTPGVGLVSSYLDFGVLARNDVDTNITCSALNSNLSAPVQTTRRIQMKLLPQQVQILNTRGTLSADTETSIRCSSWGSRPVAELTWWLGGELLHSNLSQVSGNEAYSNLTESVLRFKPTRSDSRKFLKCRAQNPEMPASEIEDSWNLDVNFKPLLDVTLGQTLDPRQIKEGDDVYFECLIVAKPPVYKISWDFNGRELKQNMRDGIIFGNQSLVLQGLEKGSSGNYSCRATNEEGVGVSKPIHLDVKYKPSCSGEQKKVYGVARGEIISINCTVEANPAVDLMFRWTFNNTSETSDIQESRFTQIGPVSNLVYSPFHELDYGTILCWAGNQLGHQQLPCIFHIIPAGPPEPPQGCRINSSSTDSIQVYCEPGFDGGLDQKFTLEVFGSEDRDLMLNRTSNTPNFRLGKLEYKKTLSLSIYSSNSKGRSEEVRLPDLKSDFLLENGPITRAAKNTEIKGEEDEDESVGEVRQENLMSIVLGVSAALVIILLVILITMSIRCGRDSNRNWGARDSGGSTSPDYLVNADPDGEFQCHGTRSISTGSITSVSPHPISATGSLPLPRRNHAPALLTLQSLPPPPPPPSGKIDPALLNDDQCTDLSPPPEWASTLLPPPDSFFTLPRKGEKLHNRSVRFEKQVHSRSITSLDNIHKSNSHVESIV